MNIVEVKRITRPTLGGIVRLVSIKCVIDGRAKTVSPDEWRTLVQGAENTVTLSEKEGEWPVGTRF